MAPATQIEESAQIFKRISAEVYSCTPKKGPVASLANLVKQLYQRHLHGQRHNFPRLRSAVTNNHCSIRKCLHQCLKHHQQAVESSNDRWLQRISVVESYVADHGDDVGRIA